MSLEQSSSVYFVSLGCPKNKVDSEVMLGQLQQHGGYHLVDEPSQAEVVIVNTCSFVGEAREESIDTILELTDYKEDKCRALVVSGCLAQHFKKDLSQSLPEVDLFIGTGQYHRITELLGDLNSGKLTGKVHIDTPTYIHSEKDPRMHLGPLQSAYLKIAEGCDRRCAFCIIPDLRGRQRSRSIESLVDEARSMASRGVKELNLISQDTIRYGRDLKDSSHSLEKLLRELVKIPELQWIRLFYVYPEELSSELISLIKNEEKICSYLDMPIQHLDNDVLKWMNRRTTQSEMMDRILELRESVPEIVLRSSVIVGFPGETEKSFETLEKGIKDLKLDHLGVFKYSHEDSTRAFDLVAKEKVSLVDKAVIRSRFKKIYEIQRKTSQKILKDKYMGKTLSVLVEGVSEETSLLLKGRHFGQAPEIDGQVLINDGSPKMGEIVKVQITETTDYDLVGGVI